MNKKTTLDYDESINMSRLQNHNVTKAVIDEASRRGARRKELDIILKTYAWSGMTGLAPTDSDLVWYALCKCDKFKDGATINKAAEYLSAQADWERY